MPRTSTRSSTEGHDTPAAGRAQLAEGWQDWANAALGGWLILAPLLGIGASKADVAAWSGYAAGAAILVVSISSGLRPQLWKESVVLVAALWLIVAPYLLGFQGEHAAMANHMIVGAASGVLALWAILRRPVRRAAGTRKSP